MSDPYTSFGERLGIHLTASQVERLHAFESLLRTRAAPLGLVSRADVPALRERHVLDCLRAAAVVNPEDRSAYDLGSGAGLPGVVVGIAVPTLGVRLVESRRRRGAFLELAVEALGLGNCEVMIARIEDLSDPVELCFARALAPPERAWSIARPLLKDGGRLVYFAGEGSTVPAPSGVGELRTVPAESLASAGPLVIMTR